MSSKKRVDLSFDNKIQGLEALENPGASSMKVAKQFKISKSQIGKNEKK